MKMIALCMIVLSLSINAQTKITYQNINGVNVISLTLENLIEMTDMSVNDWKKVMDNNYYSQAGLDNNNIIYSSGTRAYMNHTGGQIFGKSIVSPLIEYTIINNSAHYSVRDELINFISVISPHYAETKDGWNYYLLRHKMNTYQIAIFGDLKHSRILMRMEGSQNNPISISNSNEFIKLKKVFFSDSLCNYYTPVTGSGSLIKTIEESRVIMMKNIFEHFISDDPKGWELTKEYIEKKYDSNRAIPISYGSEFLLNANDYYQNTQVISISYNYSIFRGGANADYGFIVDSFDKSTGKIIEIEDVIINRRKFLTIAERQFRKENGIPESTNLNDYNCLYFKDNQFKLSNQFEFTQEGIHFIYNLYEVGCRTAGILEFTLPYSDLDGIANYIN